MLKYFLINALFCLALLALLRCMPKAPVKLRHWLSLSGIACWLIPWPMLSLTAPAWLVPQQETSFFYQFAVLANQKPTTSAFGYELSLLQGFKPLLLLFTLASLIGICLFLRDMFQHQAELKRLHIRSTPNPELLGQFGFQDSAEVRQVEGCGAMTTGILKPTIWLGIHDLEAEECRVLLLHEMNHINHFDNWRVYLIQFGKRLLWWNPFAQLFARQARFFLELHCDLKCTEQIPVTTYRETLAATMLKAAGFMNNAAPLATPFQPTWREGIARIKMLENRLAFTGSNLLAILVFAIVAGGLFALPNLNPAVKSLQTKLADVNEVPRVGQEGVTFPVFTKRVPPVYPQHGIDQKIEGYVILEATLRKNGTIDDVTVLRGLDNQNDAFSANAIAALKEWQFEPATKDGRPSDVRMTLKIDFILK